MTVVRIARISAEPLDLTAHLDAVEDATAGAITTFIGRVRDHDPDAAAAVRALEYTAHPDAERVLTALAQEASGDAGVLVAVSHRVGSLSVGEAAVIIAVAAAHRGTAFEVCRQLIERIKTDLPVWKRQTEVDGTSTWLGLGG
ncbi:molybdenum cofactor biosynthesis protein MoaE [Microbacterium sp. ET2]|uniref:molybdenum cofactor biosynthesis protein MoaE n=1 Tax=Microbacterium albipurpureum TaxID=3050384 RepID=UPI00259D2BEA|nr:molybdenum cofactor biosynthesis protein MoaE [Microbacterium sp. ET2 (Ac-2212)]WJL96301.1 molybdenum cofactor biosynthesis protein MoaE [Microbacterium sp. ET2 (Ac-2212)]